jgi:hypothetical protein
MLRSAKLKTLADVNTETPGMLDADGIWGPRIESLWDILAKKKAGRPEKHKTAQLSATEGTYLKHSRQHVTGEHATGSVYSSVLFGIPCAKVRINLIMRRSYVDLSPSPEHILWEEHPIFGSRGAFGRDSRPFRGLRMRKSGQQKSECKNPR